jgi:hypothetical protein
MDDRKIAPKMRCDELLGLATGFNPPLVPINLFDR